MKVSRVILQSTASILFPSMASSTVMSALMRLRISFSQQHPALPAVNRSHTAGILVESHVQNPILNSQ